MTATGKRAAPAPAAQTVKIVYSRQLEDVNVQERLPWNGAAYRRPPAGNQRMVAIGANHPLLACYRGRMTTEPFRAIVGATEPEVCLLRSFQGAIGLGLCYSGGSFYISVEAAALLDCVAKMHEQMPQADRDRGLVPPRWHDGSCFFTMCGAVRGCFAEHRLWCALYYHLEDKDASLVLSIPEPRLQAHVPLIRAWFAEQILDDLVACISLQRASSLLQTVALNGYLGCPDLVTWTPAGSLTFIEVKSSTDHLRPVQEKLMAALARSTTYMLYKTGCSAFCKRRRVTPMADMGPDTDEEGEGDGASCESSE